MAARAGPGNRAGGLSCTLAWAALAQEFGRLHHRQKRAELTADRPIVECLDREQRELSPSGTVRRVVGPTLTEQERAAQEVQRRKNGKSATALPTTAAATAPCWRATPTKPPTSAERANAIAQVEEVA